MQTQFVSEQSHEKEAQAQVFDGWTKGTTHYIGVSASYIGRAHHRRTAAACANGEQQQVVCHTLLLLLPLLKDKIEGMTALYHLHHLSQVL